MRHPKIRYERIQNSNRGRVEDAKTFEQFLSKKQAEMTHEGDSATLEYVRRQSQSGPFFIQ